jgi:tetratricopeptide (TPR) repeat protein
MKNKTLHYILIVSMSSFNLWSQQNNNLLNKKRINETTIISTTNIKDTTTKKKITYYHIEEVVLLKFGSYKTTYNVVNPKMINTFDLGPNGKRTITPIYKDEVLIAQTSLQTKTLLNNENEISIPALGVEKKTAVYVSETTEKTESHAYIDIIKTYERMIDKGYISADMLKKIGNYYFFNNEFEKAKKCYHKLFDMIPNAEPEYYFRYSIIMKTIGNTKISDEYLQKFNQLSNIKSK